MAVEIPSFIRAWAVAKIDPDTVNTFKGDGIDSVTRTGLGVFEIALTEPFDALRTTLEVTTERTNAGLATYAVAEPDSVAGTVTISIYHDDGITTPTPTDAAFHYMQTYGNAEAVVQSYV